MLVGGTNRRAFIAALGGAAASWPLVARAQQVAVPVIGFLSRGLPGSGGPLLAAFRQGLSETGHTAGQNVTVEYHWVEELDRLPAMAADFVDRKVDLILAIADPTARVAKNTSSTIPIVFFISGDPVADGLVASLARPGGNLTGVTLFGGELNPKRLELLCELVPRVRLIALLMNPNFPRDGAAQALSSMLEAARAKGVRLHILNATSESEIDAAFATLVELQASALIIDQDLFFFSRREQIGALAARHSVPAIYYRREFVAAGGLMSYGPNFATAYRQVGIYVGKILKGAKPADLPVLQPTQFELVVNLKAAKALGLTVSPSLLVSADELIE
jgi:putative ABC transport system substrate-binding protein